MARAVELGTNLVSNDFIDQKRDEKDVQRSLIRYFGVLHHQQGRYLEKLSLVPTTTSPNICPVDGVVHRNIGSDFFVHLFRLAFGQ